ncbi:hypothetical protein MVES1_000077 [Malassezia vespertilionis]|uniref:uncharacterized protein n=1 Tax=Malassezia vespertilionis TaxID=2020962 RepID=UPI0024B0B1BE|nr:uncharacterized protein MVES1_000077 [Malassezia vespertilionis]WFD04753.1 hypothetical protein MVES1_000077 [Malassezia vespertilionis]
MKRAAPEYGQRTLPVGVLPIDFDGIPTDGAQYLAMVRDEASKQPRIMHLASFQSVHPKPVLDSVTQRRSFVPSARWRTVFLERFNRLHCTLRAPPPRHTGQRRTRKPAIHDENGWYMYIHGRMPPDSQERQKIFRALQYMESEFEPVSEPVSEPVFEPVSGPEPVSEPVSMAESGSLVTDTSDAPDESSAWETEEFDEKSSLGNLNPLYLCQRDEAEVSLNESPSSSAMDTASDTSSCGTSADEVDAALPVDYTRTTPTLADFGYRFREPTVDAVASFEIDDILRLLQLLRKWMQQPHFTINTGLHHIHMRWIFALLARLDRRLSGEEIAGLRALARVCMTAITKQRSEHAHQMLDTQDVTTDLQVGPWLLLTVIVGAWGQLDLWEEIQGR